MTVDIVYKCLSDPFPGNSSGGVSFSNCTDGARITQLNYLKERGKFPERNIPVMEEVCTWRISKHQIKIFYYIS